MTATPMTPMTAGADGDARARVLRSEARQALGGTLRRMIGAIAARHAAAREARILAELNDHMRSDIGLPPRVLQPRTNFWVV